MKKEICLALLPLLLLAGCGKEQAGTLPETPQIITRKNVQDISRQAEPAKTETIDTDTKKTVEKENTAPAQAVETVPPEAPAQNTPTAPAGKQKYPFFEYPYTIAEDRQNYDYNHIDIIVGDKRYMTQINDWYMNFRDYKDKTVLIEGYYLSINGHHFVGRNGPTCPYCTGGYVDFEFTTDQDLSACETGATWIKVYGILREAIVHLNDHLTAPFYHLEAAKVVIMDRPGLGTITD